MRLATGADTQRLNAIANHNAVLPYISDGGALDFRCCPASSLTFLSDLGFIIFTPRHEGWEFHTAFLPEGHGRHALQAAKEAARQMFVKFSAEYLVTYTPDDCPHARPPRTFGFKITGRCENYIRGVGADEWTLTKENWRRKCQQEP